MTSQFLISIAGILSTYIIFQLAKALHEELTSPLRNLPGPKNMNVVLGHFRNIDKHANITRRWRDEFGTNFQFRGLLNRRELYTADTKALNHILVNSHLYQKGPTATMLLAHFLGNGLLAVEGDEHKRQRKILNPAFGVAQIRELTEIFNQKSIQLRDIWTRQIAEESNPARIDVFSWLRRMTLDAIGAAGFNYQFNAMDPKGRPNELNEVFTKLLHSPQSQRQAALRFARASIPILRIFPLPGKKTVHGARRKMFDIGSKLLSDSKAALKAGGGEKTATGRDLLSIMVTANMSTEIPEHQRLTDADVVAQIPTFLVAGHETTSTATAWALHALSINRSVQMKLREELLSVPTENPTMDELNSLPYLESVVRESMRVHAPAAFTIRMAMDDDVLPLNRSYVDRHGRVYTGIRIRKGTMIRIPIGDVHRDKEIWGEDAAEFRPERWDDIPKAAGSIPGVWANLMTFLAGPHNCIGFRFSIVEMKALLFTLIRAFEFGAAVPEDEIESTSTPVQRPVLRSQPEKGTQLPLIVTPFNIFC
ncbi:cytochrome P450 [Mycena maculata]|uniref:Cytochrome P450 n=1 Tax=Mycena maculata TaxID=230809 RepID=A0AAD7HQW7_9AGAR|nr:cytochrome P450 [Mycena maculata]